MDILMTTSARCPYCSKIVTMSRGVTGDHRAHGGICDGACRVVSELDSMGRAVFESLMAKDGMGRSLSVGSKVVVMIENYWHPGTVTGISGNTVSCHLDNGRDVDSLAEYVLLKGPGM